MLISRPRRLPVPTKSTNIRRPKGGDLGAWTSENVQTPKITVEEPIRSNNNSSELGFPERGIGFTTPRRGQKPTTYTEDLTPRLPLDMRGYSSGNKTMSVERWNSLDPASRSILQQRMAAGLLALTLVDTVGKQSGNYKFDVDSNEWRPGIQDVKEKSPTLAGGQAIGTAVGVGGAIGQVISETWQVRPQEGQLGTPGSKVPSPGTQKYSPVSIDWKNATLPMRNASGSQIPNPGRIPFQRDIVRPLSIPTMSNQRQQLINRGGAGAGVGSLISQGVAYQQAIEAQKRYLEYNDYLKRKYNLTNQQLIEIERAYTPKLNYRQFWDGKWKPSSQGLTPDGYDRNGPLGIEDMIKAWRRGMSPKAFREQWGDRFGDPARPIDPEKDTGRSPATGRKRNTGSLPHPWDSPSHPMNPKNPWRSPWRDKTPEELDRDLLPWEPWRQPDYYPGKEDPKNPDQDPNDPTRKPIGGVDGIPGDFDDFGSWKITVSQWQPDGTLYVDVFHQKGSISDVIATPFSDKTNEITGRLIKAITLGGRIVHPAWSSEPFSVSGEFTRGKKKSKSPTKEPTRSPKKDPPPKRPFKPKTEPRVNPFPPIEPGPLAPLKPQGPKPSSPRSPKPRSVPKPYNPVNPKPRQSPKPTSPRKPKPEPAPKPLPKPTPKPLEKNPPKPRIQRPPIRTYEPSESPAPRPRPDPWEKPRKSKYRFSTPYNNPQPKEEEEMPCRYAEDREDLITVNKYDPLTKAMVPATFMVHQGTAEILTFLANEIADLKRSNHQINNVTEANQLDTTGKVMVPQVQVEAVGALVFGGAGTTTPVKTLSGQMTVFSALNHFLSGHHQLGKTDFPSDMMNPSLGTIRPTTALSQNHWAFNQLSNLVGIPSKQEVLDVNGNKSDSSFRNQADAIESVNARVLSVEQDVASILAIVNAIAKNQEIQNGFLVQNDANVEALIKDAGFKFTNKVVEVPSLFTQSKSDSSFSGNLLERILTATKNQRVVKQWDDKFDKSQSAKQTYMQAAIAAEPFKLRIDPSGTPDLPPWNTKAWKDSQGTGTEGASEVFRKYVKSITQPDQRFQSSNLPVPKVEYFDKGALKDVPEPKDGKRFTDS